MNPIAALRKKRIMLALGAPAVGLLAVFASLPALMMPVSYGWNRTFRLEPSLEGHYEPVSLAGYPALTAPPADNADAERALVYFHGIAGREQSYIEAMRGFGRVYSPPLPGYYGRPGPTTGASMRRAAIRVVDELMDRHERVVVVGHSLGGHAAIAAGAARPGASRLILFNTFKDVGDLCAQWLGPLCAGVGDQLDSGAVAGKLALPVTQFHAIDDGVIRIDNGARLYRSMPARSEARFVPLRGGHVDFAMEQALAGVFREADRVRGLSQRH